MALPIVDNFWQVKKKQKKNNPRTNNQLLVIFES